MHRLSKLSAAIAVILAPMAASAQFAYAPAPLADSSSPYYLSASQAFTHDSNIFRDPDGAQVTSDNISTTGLRLGVDKKISRQHLSADVLVRYNKYQDNSQLDNTGYGINLRGDFETVNNISGDIHYSRAQLLAPYEDTRSTTRLTSRNMVTNDEFGLRVQYGLRAKWVLEAAGIYRNQSYSAQEFQYQEQNEGTLGVTARYRPSDLLSFGVGVRGSHGRLPNYQGVAGGATGDTFNRQDVDFSSNWQVSGLTSLNGRISATHSKHDVATERNFSGVTGEFGANYKPTGRLDLSANLSRETNDTGQLYTTTLAGGGTGSNRLQDTRVVNSLRLGALYAVTAKINANAVVRYSQRNLGDAVLVNNLGQVTGTASGTDKTTGLALGATYAISRAWSAACSIGRDRRTTDLANSTATYPFSVNTASCSASLTLR